MRIVFMGTPDFAAASLRALLRDGAAPVAVYTQPDRPKNRGMRLTASPVKELALAHGIPVLQPQSLKGAAAVEELAALSPDLVVVAAYGQLLPEEILRLPPLGCVNVHASLLPRYRGAAPIQQAILDGERETGVTLMRMVRQLDAGDILAAHALSIAPDETAGELTARLAELGGELLCASLPQLAAGELQPVPQDEAAVTYAPRLTRALSPLCLSRSAGQLHDQVRGLSPWPAATLTLAGRRCKIVSSAVCDEQTQAPPGTVLTAAGDTLTIACGGGTVLALRRIQPEGKRAMETRAFLQGYAVPAGTRLDWTADAAAET